MDTPIEMARASNIQRYNKSNAETLINSKVNKLYISQLIPKISPPKIKECLSGLSGHIFLPIAIYINPIQQPIAEVQSKVANGFVAYDDSIWRTV